MICLYSQRKHVWMSTCCLNIHVCVCTHTYTFICLCTNFLWWMWKRFCFLFWHLCVHYQTVNFCLFWSIGCLRYQFYIWITSELLRLLASWEPNQIRLIHSIINGTPASGCLSSTSIIPSSDNCKPIINPQVKGMNRPTGE